MRAPWPLWALFFVNALAVCRLTRLAGEDIITERPRRAIARRSMLAHDFLTCPWCVSVWIAAVVLLLAAFCGSWWRWIAAALAFSFVAGFLAERR